MVNENTVEYDGFVYETVTGGTKVHDLIKALDYNDDVTGGSFYLVTEIDSDGDVNFLDDVNDTHFFHEGDDDYSVFRKSHAITNDKLTDAEGVVTITLPDGTKLEGTPSDLEKITRSMQKMQNEQQGQAEQVAAVEMPVEEIEVEDESESVSERLHVGDYAKVIEEGTHSAKVGDIVKIFVDDEDNQPFKCEDLHGNGLVFSWFREHELVKATDEEVLEAKQALLKEGDFARVVGNTSNHRFETGTVVKLQSQNSTDSFTAYYLDESDFWGVYRKDLEPLTKEETEHIAREAEEEKKAKAERAKWAAIRREVGEIKKGDIVRTTSHCGSVNPVGTNGIAEYDGKTYSTATIALNGNRGNYSQVELIVPVEQRFDTVG